MGVKKGQKFTHDEHGTISVVRVDKDDGTAEAKLESGGRITVLLDRLEGPLWKAT